MHLHKFPYRVAAKKMEMDLKRFLGNESDVHDNDFNTFSQKYVLPAVPNNNRMKKQKLKGVSR